ncbi:MAG TPA: antitoxin AF2212-like protein [Candidatus Nanoarchaeia archaeon]|nr:antitoxin AF2212-like protein [Candidatus Nanoarchaeia archaeon]
MEIKVVYKKGVFMPLRKVKGFKEGEKLDVSIEKEDFHKLVVAGKSFDFLKDEEELYSEDDVVESV